MNSMIKLNIKKQKIFPCLILFLFFNTIAHSQTIAGTELNIWNTGSKIAEFGFNDNNALQTRPRVNIWGSSNKINFRTTFNTGGAKLSFGTTYVNDALLIDQNGNIGIGTDSPSSKLDVYSNTDLGIRFSGIRTHRPGSFGQFAFMDYNVNGDVSFFGSSYTGSVGQYGKISFRQYTQGNVYRDAMYIDNSGNVGVGTITPTGKLDIIGPYAEVSLNANAAASANFRTGGHVQMSINTSVTYPYTTSLQSKHATSDGSSYPIALNPLGGNVGIGTATPDSKLTVNGNIHAKEVKIDLSIPAPDYVFASDYKLKTLQEVEDYINKNSHLPEIPSAHEFEKNGLMLAEMNMNLLKKVEELTLYVIEQNKELKLQKTQLQLQNDKIILLENKIESNELCPIKN